MKGIFLFYPVWQVFFVGLMVLSGTTQQLTNAIPDAENPLFATNPQTISQLDEYNGSNIMSVTPYLADEGVSGTITDLSPLGYIKQGVNFYAQIITFRFRTGNDYIDTVIYFFFFGPILPLLVLYGILLYVRGIR